MPEGAGTPAPREGYAAIAPFGAVARRAPAEGTLLRSGANRLMLVAGKREAGVASLALPVVAVGSVPHIYRREGHSPGDPN